MPTAELAQGSIHYADEGRGPVVVLLHGVFVSSRLWREVVPALSAGHRVIAPDLPLGAHPAPLRAGADVSPPGVARLVADLLDHLGVDDVTLVGNDTGGALAQLVAAHHPRRIGRLVVTNADMLDVFPPAFFKPLVRAVQLPGVLAGLRRALGVKAIRNSPLAFGWLTVGAVPDDMAEADLAAAADPAVRRDLKRFLAGVSAAQTEQAATLLARSGLPVLLAWGADDRFFTLDLARRFVARVPSARLEVIAASATYTPLDQPGVLAGHIAAFAAATAAEGAAA